MPDEREEWFTIPRNESCFVESPSCDSHPTVCPTPCIRVAHSDPPFVMSVMRSLVATRSWPRMFLIIKSFSNLQHSLYPRLLRLIALAFRIWNRYTYVSQVEQMLYNSITMGMRVFAVYFSLDILGAPITLCNGWLPLKEWRFPFQQDKILRHQFSAFLSFLFAKASPACRPNIKTHRKKRKKTRLLL